MAKLAIIGTGFVGTSFGLAVKSAKLFDRVAGFDRDRSRAEEAQRKGGLDVAERKLQAVVDGAALVVVTVPEPELEGVFHDLTGALMPGSLVTDTCTWKVPAQRAARALPSAAYFVGGRPVLDGRGQGPGEARADVFKGAVYCLTPDVNVPAGAVNGLSAVVSGIGAQPYFLDAQEHDNLTGATELMPGLAVAALLTALTGERSWKEIGRVAGDTLAGWTELAQALDPSFWEQAQQNQEAVSLWLDLMAARLRELKEQLQSSDEPAAAKQWSATQQTLDQWRRDKRRLSDPMLPPTAELRPNVLGSLTGFGLFRRKPPK